MNEFVLHILNILQTNGFPAKRVSLPTEKMYEVADNKGLNFNRVLESLKENHQVDYQITTDKIIFFPLELAKASNQAGNQEDMMKQAQEMMSKMSPEELKKIQDMLMNMSEEDKAELMKKGKEMGFI